MQQPPQEGLHQSHPHELRLSSGGYRCDVCNSADSRRYHCTTGCNFDVCGQCWDKGPITCIMKNPLTQGNHVAHPHTLKVEAAVGYSCDLCRGKDDRRYHCTQGCNFDVCGKCWDKGPVLLVPETPPSNAHISSGFHGSHAHQLTSEAAVGYSCDLCRGKDDRRYRCKACNFDVCGKCWDKGPVTAPTPVVQTPEVSSSNAHITSGIHGSHAHQLTSEAAVGYSCDLCKGKDDRRYRCKACNFDVCGKCWDKGPVTVPTPVLPTPVASTNAHITAAIHPSHAHELKSEAAVGYSCDLCRGNDDRRYRCKACNFDVCGKCWDKGPLTPTSVPTPTSTPTTQSPNAAISIGTHGSHPHELKSDSNLGYSCDLCRAKDDRRYHCTQGCNYDVCGKCWDTGTVTPSVPKPVPTPTPAPSPAPVAVSSPSSTTSSTPTHSHTSGIHGSHPHELVPESSLGYSCDVCRGKDERRFHCSSGCNYDVCGKCWDKGPVNPVPKPIPTPAPTPTPTPVAESSPSQTATSAGPTHSHTSGIHGSHPHELVPESSLGYSCDVCRGKDDRRFHCSSGCNYDVCGKCWDKGPVTPAPPKPKPAPEPATPSRVTASPAVSGLFAGGGPSQYSQDYLTIDAGKHGSHPHELIKAQPFNFRCDVCKLSDLRRYTCNEGCDYDVCGKCWDKGPVVPSEPKAEQPEDENGPKLSLEKAQLFMAMNCPVDDASRELVESQPPGWKLHPMHPLRGITSRGSWGCNQCGANGTNLVKRYKCISNCFFDLCHKCYTGGENELKSSGEPELISPGPPEITGLPFRNEYDETQTVFWKEFREPYVGQILFSDTPIERFFDPSQLKKEFNVGSEINARAIWPRAFRNYPLGHPKNNPNVPTYGPKYILSNAYGSMALYILQVFVFVRVDGVTVSRTMEWNNQPIEDALLMANETGPKPPGSYPGSRNDSSMREYEKNFKPETVDFWAMNQSMTFGLVREKINRGDNWERGMSTLMRHLGKLAPGDHTVEAELRFRLVGNTEDCRQWRAEELLPAEETWPSTFPTPLSHSMARGQFVLRIPEGGAASVQGGVRLDADPFPKRATNLDLSEATRLEGIIWEYMKSSREWGSRAHQTERILKVVLTGNWCKLMKEHQCKHHCSDPCPKYEREPQRYNIDFVAVCYRSPTDGWEKEMPCRAFNLGAFAFNTRPASAQDLIGVGVANSYEFDVEDVPESAYAEAGLKRCPLSLRKGFAK